MRSCTQCQAPMIEGITPASQGWCSAECDLRVLPPQTTCTVPLYLPRVYEHRTALASGRALIVLGENYYAVLDQPLTYRQYTVHGDYSIEDHPFEGEAYIVRAGPGGCTLERVPH